MKISKYVDFGQEVEVTITTDDIRAALAEAFNTVTTDRLGEEGPNRNDVLLALNSMASFLNALSDEQIDMLQPGQRDAIQKFLVKAAARFASRTQLPSPGHDTDSPDSKGVADG